MWLEIDNGGIFFSITDKKNSLRQKAGIKAHTKRFMRIAYVPESSFIMPISEDGKYKWSDISACESVHEERLKCYAGW